MTHGTAYSRLMATEEELRAIAASGELERATEETLRTYGPS